jgi:UDPglucose 6-dehydrogenase
MFKDQLPIGTSQSPAKAYRGRSRQDPYSAAGHAQALLLLTEWPEYRELDLVELGDQTDVPVVVDGRNLFDPGVMQRLGFEYLCMGR